MNKQQFLLLVLLFCSSSLLAQNDTLPKFSAKKKNGEISISWISVFKNASQINIQRSKDSTRNFSTIHSLPNPNVKSYTFTDKTAKNDSGFYRVFILLEGSNYFFTASKRLFIDTSTVQIIKPIVTVKQVDKPKAKEQEEKPAPPPPKPVWVPSIYVFTGDDGNAVIKLPDAAVKKYSIRFMKEDGSELFLIPQIKESYLTLDKVNFLKSGWYFFELIENGQLKEKNKFLITRDN